ncbi:unnamed protein product [Polarella glacialis]|uniref:Uncharacterized protein n=1 Tax=Polarella glacialis TaxID=89957 RepID=A0A813FDK0_POLGL|nr:unnamed protein product [Polarella glacialis]
MLSAGLLSHRSAWCTKLQATYSAATAASPKPRVAPNITLASGSTAQGLQLHSSNNSGMQAVQLVGKEPGSTNNHLLHLRADGRNPVPQHVRSQNRSYGATFGARRTGGWGEQEKLDHTVRRRKTGDRADLALLILSFSTWWAMD